MTNPKTLPTQQGTGDLEAYPTGLSLEKIAELVHHGPGSRSMRNALNAWLDLYDMRYNLSFRLDAALSAIKKNWSGPAAQAMQQTVAQHITWTKDINLTIFNKQKFINEIADAFDYLQKHCISLEKVNENRIIIEKLRATDKFGINTLDIEELEAQYNQWRATAIGLFLWYYDRTAEAANKLTPWPEPEINHGFRSTKGAHRGLPDA